jgi:hypothetical protein
MMTNPNISSNLPRKKRECKTKKSVAELIRLFWDAPPDAFFSQVVIAPVAGCTPKTMECDRWRGRGIPYRKCSGRVLYRKSDVIAWLENHQLVNSTSEYKEESHA